MLSEKTGIINVQYSANFALLTKKIYSYQLYQLQLDTGLDMVDKAGIAEKLNRSEMT